MILAVSVLMAGCVYDNYDGYHPGPVHDPYPYDYYYYPSVGVYYHLHSGYYYYHDNHHWYRSRKLPPRYHLDPRDRIKFRDRDDRPYLNYDRHREKYKPSPNYKGDRAHDHRERESNRQETPSGNRGFGDGAGSAPAEPAEREAPVQAPGERPRGWGG